MRSGDEVRQTLDEALAVWRAIDDAVREVLASEPDTTFLNLYRQVVRAVAPALGIDPEFDGIPAGSVATIAAHWRASTQ